MDNRKQYVLGFLFNDRRDSVVLIRKNRPEWQAGKLNGVGGKMEAEETPAEAMSREFREETDMDIPDIEWEQVALLQGHRSVVFVFRSTGNVWNALTMTDERVEVWATRNVIPSDGVPNLQWLLPFCAEPTPREASVFFGE